MSIVLFDIFFIWEEEKLLSLIMFITNKEKTIPFVCCKNAHSCFLSNGNPQINKKWR